MSLVITQGYVGSDGNTITTSGYGMDGDHLQAFCLAAGVVTSKDDHLDYNRALSSAQKQWERETGFTPFAPTAQTRVYDAPNGKSLELSAGLVTLDSIEASDGRGMLINQDYYLSPRSAPAYDAPYTSIHFAWPTFGYPNTLTVRGLFGYALEVPDDVTEAILCLAASKIVPTRSSQVGAAVSIKQDDVELQFSSISTLSAHYTAQQNQFRDTYKSALIRYKKQVLA